MLGYKTSSPAFIRQNSEPHKGMHYFPIHLFRAHGRARACVGSCFTSLDEFLRSVGIRLSGDIGNPPEGILTRSNKKRAVPRRDPSTAPHNPHPEKLHTHHSQCRAGEII